jgi:dihydroorotate dehydrogenase (NAD+) catalytic subunit
MSGRRFRSRGWMRQHASALSSLGGVEIGGVALPSPVMTASGTAGHANELGSYFDTSLLGAMVVKSLSAEPWAGNASPRVHPTPAGMINAVGLQGPGVATWLKDDLPALVAAGVRVVVSVWGRSVDEYAQASRMLADAVPAQVVALEVNLSCPNLEGRRGIFAHDADLSAEVVAACSVAGLPMWAKLSPNTDRVVEVAGAVREAGADAVTLINTALGMVIDVETGKPVLGNGGGGLSGAAIHPIAVRTVHDVHQAIPQLDIIGVGGVRNGVDAIELMIAGAKAVQVGTATFADPCASIRVADEMVAWMQSHGHTSWRELRARG